MRYHPYRGPLGVKGLKNCADFFHITIFLSQKSVCETGKDLYLHISLDKVDTAVPTRAYLLLPFVLSVLLGWKSVYETGCQWKDAKLWPRQVFQVRNGHILPFKCELYLCRNFKNTLTCSVATIHSCLAASLSSTLTFWRRNYYFLILAHPVYKMWIIQEPNVRIMKQTAFWRE